ncbi:MAG: DUF1569 domain-containing protein [Chitinophagales bacterium]
MISTGNQQQLTARIEKLTPESKALWGKMSVNQMLAHMNDAFRIALGMKAAVDKSNFFWNKIAFPVAVYVLPGFPKSSPTAKELNQLQEGTAARDFYTEAGFAIKMMEVFNEREESKLKPHPMFGKLSKQQWSDLLVKHFDHHLKQFGV